MMQTGSRGTKYQLLINNTVFNNCKKKTHQFIYGLDRL